MKTLLVIALLVAYPAANAEVSHSSATGFKLTMVRTVPVAPEIAYKKFLQVDHWWVESHTWFGNRENLTLDPVAGGCFCEIEGVKQVQHLTVAHVNPGVEFRMMGGLGPLQDMAITGAATWKFKAVAGGAEISHTYTVAGPSFSQLETLAPVVDAVHAEQLNALVTYIGQ